MTGQICKVWLAKFNEAGYALTDAERDAALAQDQAAVQAAGGRTVLVCDSAWSNEQWPNWGFEVFPNLEGHMQYVQAQKKLNWFRYFLRSRTLLGTLHGEIAAHTPAPGEVYKLWMANGLPMSYSATPTQAAEMLERVNSAMAQVGGKRIVLCDARWATEEWDSWGVEVLPDAKAVQEYSRLLNGLQLLRYLDSWTILGTAVQGS
jgi:hypothetical protein